MTKVGVLHENARISRRFWRKLISLRSILTDYTNIIIIIMLVYKPFCNSAYQIQYILLIYVYNWRINFFECVLVVVQLSWSVSLFWSVMGWSATMNVAFPGHTNLLVLSINVNIQYAPRREKTSYWGGGGLNGKLANTKMHTTQTRYTTECINSIWCVLLLLSWKWYSETKLIWNRLWFIFKQLCQ